MKNINLLIFSVVVFSAISIRVPVYAGEATANEQSEQENQQKNECLLRAINCGRSASSIQDKIEMHNDETNKTRLGDTYLLDSRAAGEHIDLARKLPRTIYGDNGLRGTRGAHNLYLTQNHQNERYCAVSWFNWHLSPLHYSRVSVFCNTANRLMV